MIAALVNARRGMASVMTSIRPKPGAAARQVAKRWVKRDRRRDVTIAPVVANQLSPPSKRREVGAGKVTATPDGRS